MTSLVSLGKIDGFYSGSNTGHSVSLVSDTSSSGTWLAVGAHRFSEINGQEGQVRVYKYDLLNKTFNQIGNSITGNLNDNLGINIALSSTDTSGQILVIGAPTNTNINGPGSVRVYRYNDASNNLNLIGSVVGNNSTSNRFGINVAVSSNGTRFAGSSGAGGYVRVYNIGSSTLTKVGSDITGATNISFGVGLCLNSIGDIVAIGAPGGRGLVRVYKSNNNVWSQVGSDISDNTLPTAGNLGQSVSLSSNGTILAVGIPGGNGGRGLVRVYKSNNNVWSQVGSDISDNTLPTTAKMGYSVNLSSDGTILAVGIPYASTNSKGLFRLYKYSDNWNKFSQDIIGTANSESMGWSVSLNQDGTIVAAGSPFAGSGKVEVYSLTKLLNIPRKVSSFLSRL